MCQPECACAAQLAEANRVIADLRTALQSSRYIAAAVGIVMATDKITYDQAFDVLVVASQHTHRKVRDIAEDVVATGSLDWAAAYAG